MTDRNPTDPGPEIVVSARPPFAIEMMVYEEDRWRILSAGNHIRDIREPLNELESKMTEQRSHDPGELIVAGSRAFAILHDLDRTTPFCDDALTRVLTALAIEAQAAGWFSIGTQALGHVHGPLSLDESVLLISAWQWPASLRRIWIDEG